MGQGAEFLDQAGLENHIKTKMSARNTTNASQIGNLGSTGAESKTVKSRMKKTGPSVETATGSNPWR